MAELAGVRVRARSRHASLAASQHFRNVVRKIRTKLFVSAKWHPVRMEPDINLKRQATAGLGLNSLPVFMTKSTRDDPNKVDRLIAEFPGPVCLQASPFKWWPVIAAGPAIAALLAFVVISSDLQHGRALNGDGEFLVFVGLFIGLLAVAFGRRGLKGSLRLDVDGFRATSAMQKQYRWSDVKDFSPYGFKSGGQVVFDMKTERHGTGAAYWPGANTPPHGEPLSTSEMKSFSGVPYRSMPDNYGLAAGDLARLMNSWRQLAIQTSVGSEGRFGS